MTVQQFRKPLKTLVKSLINPPSQCEGLEFGSPWLHHFFVGPVLLPDAFDGGEQLVIFSIRIQ